MKIPASYVFVLFFVLGIEAALPQRLIRGIVQDAESGTPLVFANIRVNDMYGTVSDTEGHFSIKIPDDTDKLTITYIGYKDVILPLSRQNYYVVKMIPEENELEAVVLSAKVHNPAIALMKKVISRKKENDYRRKLREYAFTKYFRLLVSMDKDSLNGKLDSVYVNGILKKVDSTNYHLKKMLQKRDLYLMENVTRITAANGKEKNKILAQKMAGFKNPIYEILAYQMNGYDIYDDTYKFFIKKYTSPLSPISFGQYRYRIKDTLKYKGAKVINVAYRNTVKPLVSGNMYIDTRNYAIAYMSLHTDEKFTLHTDYVFEYYPEHKVWMPTYSQSELRKAEGRQSADIDGTISFSFSPHKENDSIEHTNRQDVGKYFYIRILNRYSAVDFKPVEKNKGFDLEVSSDRISYDDDFWKPYRDSVTMRRAELTYRYIDSLSEKGGLEKKIRKTISIAHGIIPMGKVDWLYGNLLSYNLYEGFRLNAEFATNNNLSRRWRISSYAGYGFQDRTFKYGGTLRYKIHHGYQTYLSAFYKRDLEHKGTSLIEDTDGGFMNSLMEHDAYAEFRNIRTYGMSLSWLPLPELKNDISADYRIYPGTGNGEDTETMMHYGMQWDYRPKARFYLNEYGRQMLSEGFPVFLLDTHLYVPYHPDGAKMFYTVSTALYWDFTWYPNSTLSLYTAYGFSSVHTPLWKCMGLTANDRGTGSVFQRLLPTAGESFETVWDGEFYNPSIYTVRLRQRFSNLPIGAHFHPDISLTGRVAWGLSDRFTIPAGDLQKGLWEAGLEMEKLFNISFLHLGVGLYYRLGAYSRPALWDNFSLRLRFTTSVQPY